MNITDVRIRKINDESKMKAVVSITFDDEDVYKRQHLDFEGKFLEPVLQSVIMLISQ